MEREDRQKMADAVASMIDAWVSKLLDQIRSGDNSLPKRGLWDRFKGGVSNIFYGRDNEENPYYWMNRFGDDMGSKGSWRNVAKSECFNPGIFTLSEYGFLKSSFEGLEWEVSGVLSLNESGFEDLKIYNIIKGSAEKLKGELRSFIMGGEAISASADNVDAEPGDSTGDDATTAKQPPPPSNQPPERKIGDPKGARGTPPPPKDDDSKVSARQKNPENNASPPTPTPTPEPEPTSLGNSPDGGQNALEKNASPPSSTPTPTPEPTSLGNSSDTGASEDKFNTRLKETIKALKKGDHQYLTPNDSWLTGSGKLSILALPKTIAWLGMKSHVDMSDDEQAERELKKALGERFTGLISKKRSGNTLISNLAKKLPEGSLESTLSDLGVDEKLLEKMRKKDSDQSQDQDQDQGSGGEDPEGLKKIKEIQKSDNIEAVLSSITERIIKPVLQKTATANKQAMKDWWRRFKGQNQESISSLKAYLMSGETSQFLNELMRISGLSEEEILNAIV